MQHFKNTKKPGEFEKFIDNDDKTGLYLEDTLKFFEIQRIFRHFESVKKGGINVVLVLSALLVMLFYNGRNIHNFFSRQFGKVSVKKNIKSFIYPFVFHEKRDISVRPKSTITRQMESVCPKIWFLGFKVT